MYMKKSEKFYKYTLVLLFRVSYPSMPYYMKKKCEKTDDCQLICSSNSYVLLIRKRMLADLYTASVKGHVSTATTYARLSLEEDPSARGLRVCCIRTVFVTF